MPLTEFSDKTLGSTNADPGASAELIAATLIDLCAIWRNTPSDDGQGSQAANWALLTTDVPCRFEKVSMQKEILQAGTVAALSTWLLVLPVGTDILPTDEVVKGTDVFVVTGDDSPITNPLYLSVMLIWQRNQSL